MRVIYHSLGGLGSSDPRCHTKCNAGCIYCSKKKGSTKTVWDRTEEIYSVYIIYHYQIRETTHSDGKTFQAGRTASSCTHFRLTAWKLRVLNHTRFQPGKR